MNDAAQLEAQVRECLRGLAPLQLHYEDQSAAHAGHAGARQGAHVALAIESAAFAGLTRVQRHRLVHERLAGLLAGRIHALALSLRAPGEAP